MEIEYVIVNPMNALAKKTLDLCSLNTHNGQATKEQMRNMITYFE